MVDDEQDLCDILLFNLQIMGFQAEAAYSAEEALGKIMTPKKERGEGTPSPEPYDLMLLDVMMPGMSGFELAAKLKADEQTRHIPIIFLTAKDTEDDLLQGFSLGADDYVKKPFSIREVIARVNVVINRNAPHTDGVRPAAAADERAGKGVQPPTVARLDMAEQCRCHRTHRRREHRPTAQEAGALCRLSGVAYRVRLFV